MKRAAHLSERPSKLSVRCVAGGPDRGYIKKRSDALGLRMGVSLKMKRQRPHNSTRRRVRRQP